MRTSRVVPFVALLVALGACQATVSGQASAPAPSGTAKGGHGSLRFRPVVDSASITAKSPELDTVSCAQPKRDDPSAELRTCDTTDQVRYILGPAFLDSTQIASASAGPDPNGAGFVINLKFRSEGAKAWADYTAAHVGGDVAFVLNGKVLSAPRIESAITGGDTQISGQFTQDQAQRLARQIAGG